MDIYIKTLSGCIQPLSFSHKDVTIKIVKEVTYRPGYVVCFFRNGDDGDDGDYKEDIPQEYLGDDEKVSNGETLNIFYIREDFTKEDNEKFESSLKNLLKKFYINFRETIIKYDALIAGGSVLSVFGGYGINDLDIYVHYSKAQDFIKTLFIHGCSYSDMNEAPAYDQSFFRKNNIKARICMGYYEYYYDSEVDRQQRRLSRLQPRYTSIDIMIIPDHIPLESVVTNFDLTFCQVWWNGKKIFSDHIEDVKSKSGSLNKEYISSYLSLNSFIIKRIQKYKSRGFNINIDLTEFQNMSIYNTSKTIHTCYNTWARTCIFKYLTRRFFNKLKESHIFSYFKIQESLEQCKDVYEAVVQNCYKDVLTYIKSDNYKQSFIDTYPEITKIDMRCSSINIINNWARQIILESETQILSVKEDRKIILNHYKGI